MTGRPGKTARNAARIPLAEWVIAAVSALIVLGAIGLLVGRGLRAHARAPDIVVAPDSTIRTAAGWQVIVSVDNLGDVAAAAVEIEGVLGAGTSGEERSGFVLDFLAGRSTRRGALLFSRDPRADPLSLRALGYAEP